MKSNILKSAFAAALAISTFTIPNTAHASFPAAVGDCAAFSGTSLGGWEDVSFAAKVGDVISWSSPEPFITVNIQAGEESLRRGTYLSGSSGTGEFTYTADTEEDINIYIFFGANNVNKSSAIAPDRVTFTCTPAGGGVEVAASVSGATQTSSMSAAVGQNAQGRLGGAGQNSFLPTDLFASSGVASGDNPEWNFWVAGQVHDFSGGLDGNGFDLNLGVDKLLTTDSILGFTIGIEDLDFGATTVRSVAYGPYYAQKFANGSILDFMLTYAEPDYGAGVEGERWSLAANWTGGEIQTAMGTLQPFVNASGFSEDINTGASVEERRVFAGGKFTFFTDSAITPFVRAAADYKRVENSTVGSDSFLHPLLGIGASGSVGAGSFSTELLYRKYSSDTRNLSASVRIDFPF